MVVKSLLLLNKHFSSHENLFNRAVQAQVTFHFISFKTDFTSACTAGKTQNNSNYGPVGNGGNRASETKSSVSEDLVTWLPGYLGY